MATSLAPVITQLLDNLGDLLNGGTIDTYAAGTTTRLATYTDLAGAVPNANPVVLDAYGRATVRLTDGVAYKFVIKDSGGNAVQTIDNIIAGVSPTGDSYFVHSQFLGDAPTAQQIVLMHVFGENVSFPLSMTASAWAHFDTAPTGSADFDMQYDGVSFGTLTVDTNGDISITSDALSAEVGHWLTLIAPASATDGANFAITFKGSVA